ncbi:uncharacterized protein RBU47_007809 [Passerculus sandwichensis]
MAAVPHNNLREQLQRHSARGALRAAPPPARDRPPGFTFKKAPRGLGAAAVLRDKDVNISLALPASAPPHAKAPPRDCVPWDDIDDFDLSGIEKKFCRPPLVSPKGLRAPVKEPPRPGPSPAPRGSPGTPGPGGGGEAAAEAEPRPCSQRSVICLEDSAAGPGCGERDAAEPRRDAGSAGARPAWKRGSVLPVQEQQLLMYCSYKCMAFLK